MQIPLDNLKSSLRDRIDLLIKIGFGVAVAIGCYFVVAPFATAILISAMLCVVTWPFFIRVDTMLGHRRTLSAVLMVAFLAVIVLIAHDSCRVPCAAGIDNHHSDPGLGSSRNAASRLALHAPLGW